MRFVKIEIVIYLAADGNKLARIVLIGGAAVRRGHAHDDGTAIPVETEPQIVVPSVLIKIIVYVFYGGETGRIGIEPHFRHLPALILKFFQRIQHQRHDVVVGYGVGVIEQQVIDIRHRKQFHVPRDHPGIFHRIIAVKRLAGKMELVRRTFPRIIRVVERGIVAQLFQLVYVVNARHRLRTEPGEVKQSHVFLRRAGRIGHFHGSAVIVRGDEVCDAVFLRG